MTRRVLTVVLAFCAILVAGGSVGCDSATSSTSTAPADNKPVAVATVAMVGDLVSRVAGDHVTVRTLLGPGVDPHLYKPTRDDIKTLRDANAVFFVGHHLEGGMSETLHNLGSDRSGVALAEKIDQSLVQKDEHGAADPHLWMDVSLWSQSLPIIVTELSRIAPQHADAFGANAQSLKSELDRLHSFGVEAIRSIPSEQRLLITSHDAFAYLGRAYGIEVKAIQGISTESEAGLKQINDLVELIVTRKVRAVFIESSVSPKGIQALVDGAASRGHAVVIGGELFSDAMGAPGTYEGTYIGMMDHNLTLIARALGGNAPETGLNGKLNVAQGR